MHSCQRLWALLDHRGRHAIEIVERYADDAVPADELVQTEQLVDQAWRETPESQQAAWHAITTVWFLVSWETIIAARGYWAEDLVVNGVLKAVAESPIGRETSCTAENRTLCNLLRDVVNPFFQYESFPSCGFWNSTCVSNLANAIYEDKAFDQMPILADALEDVGSIESSIIEHCRSDIDHVRGCWVIDLLTQRR